MTTKDYANSRGGPETDGKKSPRTASRGALALGFSYIGAKVGTLGTLMDIDKVPGTESLSFGQKLWQVVNGKLLKHLWEEIKKIPTFTEQVKFASKTSKFTLITTGIGMAAGAVLGWMRGDRIKKPSDLLFHPVKSLKLAFGPKSKEPERADVAPAQNVAARDSQASPGKAVCWTQAVSQPQQTAEAVPGR